MSQQQNKFVETLVEGYKDFLKRHERIPSIFELAKHIGWKKSITNKHLERAIGMGIFKREEGVSKSLILIKK